MITYKEYEEIRKSKGMKDSDVARIGGFNQSVLSDWKREISTPKMDKMQKIADALEMDYYELVGPVGKFSRLNPDRTVRITVTAKNKDVYQELIDLYRNATPDAQKSVMTLLKNSQKETSASSKEA